jgi:hypothetical protein
MPQNPAKEYFTRFCGAMGRGAIFVGRIDFQMEK